MGILKSSTSLSNARFAGLCDGTKGQCSLGSGRFCGWNTALFFLHRSRLSGITALSRRDRTRRLALKGESRKNPGVYGYEIKEFGGFSSV